MHKLRAIQSFTFCMELVSLTKLYTIIYKQVSVPNFIVVLFKFFSYKLCFVLHKKAFAKRFRPT